MPTPRSKSLFQLHPWRWDLIALVAASFALLYYGLTMPIITFKKMGIWTDTFTVLSGIQQLKQDGFMFLAVIVFLFSIVFPAAKLTALTAIWFTPMTEGRRKWMLYWLGMLGKWSMLDVFVVAVTIVITKVGKLIHAEPRPGLFIFAGAVFLSMVASFVFDRLANRTRAA
jgi:paraquat-inducible protein A